jgi:hypothetical protein
MAMKGSVAGIFSVILINLGVADRAVGQLPTTNDLWDINQGSFVTAHSGTTSLSSPANMFGGVSPMSAEPFNTLFRDDQLAGFVHFVEWGTPTPVLVESFNLFATHDGPPFDANQRGFRRFTLFAKDPETGIFEQVFEFFPTNPYTIIGPEGLLISTTISPVIAHEFRAEFEQFGDAIPSARGPRVRELDGFGVAIPEPSSLTLFGLGLVGAAGYGWRRWRPGR